MLDLYKAKKRVLITGGTSGTGAEAVREFTGCGAEVVFFYRKSDDKAFALSKETGALNIRCNVSNPESVRGAMEVANEFLGGGADVLICNAGTADFGPITNTGIDRWNDIINTELNSAFYCINEVLPGMMERGKGSIIIVASLQGQTGATGEAAYSAARAGLVGLTKALAREAGPSGVRVNCITSGITDTELNNSMDKAATLHKAEETPLGRKGTASEIAKTMAFLASDDASYITGQVIGVDGGISI